MKELERVTSIPDESNADVHSYATYASFGDEGVTATANAYGNLLQFTRYFGNEPSGFYCVDLPDTPPPYLTALRLDKLRASYQDRNAGMRLEFEKSEGSEDWTVNIKPPPIMKFIDDRWPLFVAETPLFNLNIQYTISKKTIYQQYSFELKNGRQIDNIPNMLINADLLIRNLNFVESNIENNRGDPEKGETFYETRHDTRIIRKHHSLQTGIADISAVGLVIMPFINDQYHKIEEKHRNIYQIIPGHDVLQDLNKHRKMVVTISYTLELMGSNGSSLAPDNVSKATQRSLQAKKDLSTAKSEMESKFETLLFAKERYLNFILRRNLEHILSVCSIPIGNPSETGIVPIALTCGDISNHRIMAGASL